MTNTPKQRIQLERISVVISEPLKDSTDLKTDKTMNQLRDGTIILGKTSRNRYVTRYRIGREEQRKMIQQSIAKEMCPCCHHKEEAAFLRTIWLFLKSEPFLLVLNIIALTFSVLKKALPGVDVDHKMERVHGSIETFVAVTSIAIRLTAGYEKFHEEKLVRREIEHCINSVRTHTLKLMMQIYYLVGIILITFLIISFSLFVVYDKLYWTIVTTNFALVVGGVGGNLVIHRLERMVSRIREDQHKAILFEAISLLKGHEKDAKNDDATGKIELFCNAVKETELLRNKGQLCNDQDENII